MKIGIDASRAFLKQRTGIEEYAFQVISHLKKEIDCDYEVVLYVRKGQVKRMHELEFILPHHWSVREIKLPRFWTQIGLSLEMQKNPVDVLFVPAHTVPLIHPKNSIVTVHGLEYEFCPKAYAWWERIYMRWSIKYSCKWAKKIIAVSENTKKDLINLYKVSPEKIEVIYEGVSFSSSQMREGGESASRRSVNEQSTHYSLLTTHHLLFVGRIEERKNIIHIIEAFELLKEKYHVSHKLVLAGKPGYGYKKIKRVVQKSKYKEDIIEMGYISEQEKWMLLKYADIFVFPTLYEGFGLPILEAQMIGVPVITSTNASLPEISGEGALTVNPYNKDEIAEALQRILSNNALRDTLIQKGKENVQRFSWQKCANQIAEVFYG